MSETEIALRVIARKWFQIFAGGRWADETTKLCAPYRKVFVELGGFHRLTTRQVSAKLLEYAEVTT